MKLCKINRGKYSRSTEGSIRGQQREVFEVNRGKYSRSTEGSIRGQQREVFEVLCHNFTIQKSNRTFSSIGIDQAHEQNNKIVKIDGGAVGLFDNEQAILEWTITGPYIAEMVSSFSDISNGGRR